MYRLDSILLKAGLSGNWAKAVGQLSRLVMVARMALMTIRFLEMSTPYGWMMGIMGGVSTGIGFGALLAYPTEGR